MITEKRKAPRINSHIVVEMNLPGQFPKHCGYIENLSERGMGVISLDPFQPGDQLSISFILPGTIDRIMTVASIVRTQPSMGMLNYYAFTFENISQDDCHKITNFVRENAA
ncbi:MAG: PilZ domain-containing protein [Firmicutes bacterium]|nr:PilZ domain-containing protein [Bacillota bacterium]